MILLVATEFNLVSLNLIPMSITQYNICKLISLKQARHNADKHSCFIFTFSYIEEAVPAIFMAVILFSLPGSYPSKSSNKIGKHKEGNK